MPLRLIFMGTPDFAAHPLAALIDAGHEIAAVYTRPPQPAGRGMKTRPSPVHELAATHNIPVETPLSLRTPEAHQKFASYRPDLAIVAAYGLILPEAILTTPEQGCWNIHASLLPRWRGAAPIQRAIMAGDDETGISIMQMEAGLDTGPVWLTSRVPILPTDSAQSLHDRLMARGAETLLQALNDRQAGRLPLQPQAQNDALACYAEKIDKAEARIEWQQSALHIERMIRGLSPFPGAWCEMDGARVKIISAESDLGRAGPCGHILNEAGWIGCGSGAVRPLRVQRAGKSEMDFEAFLRGQKLSMGQKL